MIDDSVTDKPILDNLLNLLKDSGLLESRRIGIRHEWRKDLKYGPDYIYFEKEYGDDGSIYWLCLDDIMEMYVDFDITDIARLIDMDVIRAFWRTEKEYGENRKREQEND